MISITDRFLLFRIRTQQDPEAFGLLYDRYVKAIYRFVLLKVPSKEDAEDLTADIFLKAWNYLQEHHDITHLRALLYKIARNTVIDWYRSRSNENSNRASVTFSSFDTSTNREDTSLDQGDAGRGSELMQVRAELSIVMGKLERLKDDYRDILMLRLIDNLPFSLIAKIMDRTPGTVRVLYHRAKKALDTLNDRA